MSDNKFVTADAQFGNAKILRPFPTYDTVYNGLNALNPIMWTEGGVALDSNAGKTGYSHYLLRGLTVPFGARIVLYLPVFWSTGDPNDQTYHAAAGYTWTFYWRLRNLYDFRMHRISYHLPKQSPGITDATPIVGGQRVLLPAAGGGVTYAQAEAMRGISQLNQPANLHAESIIVQPTSLMSPLGVTLNMPLTPDSTGILDKNGEIQQGVFPSGTMMGIPMWIVHEMQACGDELLIGQNRTQLLTPYPNWGFVPFYGGQPIAERSDMMMVDRLAAAPDFGVYVFVGSAP